MDARFREVDARMDAMEARLEAILTGIAITTAIIVALFIHYLG